MVYSFVTGMVVGFPLGCMLREKGYHHRFLRAYNEINPKDPNRKCILKYETYLLYFQVLHSIATEIQRLNSKINFRKVKWKSKNLESTSRQ